MSHTLRRPGEPAFRSPLLDLPGAVPGVGVEAGTARHYGDPLGEQRVALDGVGLYDGSSRNVLQVSGVDRLAWLDAICAQDLATLPDFTSTRSAILSAQGYIRIELVVTELGSRTWIVVDPYVGAPLLEHLNSSRFRMRVDLADVTATWSPMALVGAEADAVLAHFGVETSTVPPFGVVSMAGGGWVWHLPLPRGPIDALIVPRSLVRTVAHRLLALGVRPVGTDAIEILRAGRRTARTMFEIDDHTYPNEVGFVGESVSLDKPCYPGRRAVAALLASGRPPPRRLVLLRLDCPADAVPPHGTPLTVDGRWIGFVGTSGNHVELGPIALALVPSEVPDDAALAADGVRASVASPPGLVPP